MSSVTSGNLHEFSLLADRVCNSCHTLKGLDKIWQGILGAEGILREMASPLRNIAGLSFRSNLLRPLT